MNVDRVILARVGAAHGLKGEVRLRSFTADPMAVASYGALTAPDGRSFEITALRPAPSGGPEMLVARFAGVADRTAAEALNGLDLAVPRDRLPATGEDDFYHADLIGLAAMSPDGAPLGRVVAIHDFGSGDLIEIGAPGDTVMVPFTRAAVPVVDIAGGHVVIDMPPEVEAREDR
ncbi:MAG: ribosome maturation factor RimM [Bauldia sp.]|nr:ribosome maturation factor RimM [Bauldia sp.]